MFELEAKTAAKVNAHTLKELIKHITTELGSCKNDPSTSNIPEELLVRSLPVQPLFVLNEPLKSIVEAVIGGTPVFDEAQIHKLEAWDTNDFTDSLTIDTEKIIKVMLSTKKDTGLVWNISSTKYVVRESSAISPCTEKCALPAKDVIDAVLCQLRLADIFQGQQPKLFIAHKGEYFKFGCSVFMPKGFHLPTTTANLEEIMEDLNPAGGALSLTMVGVFVARAHEKAAELPPPSPLSLPLPSSF